MKGELSLKDRWLDNPLWIAVTDLALIHGGMEIMKLLADPMANLSSQLEGAAAEFVTDATDLFLYMIPIILCLLYMFLTKRSSLNVFVSGTAGKRIRSLLKGLLIGFILNGVVSLVAGLTGTVQYSFQSFVWYLPALLPFSFIQCSCEEVLLRGYVPAYMEPRHQWGAVAFVSGTLFVFHHVENMHLYGFSTVFCLNVFLIGVLSYLFVRDQRNFWIACGIHTGWNYTQEYLFGLPNSGISSPISLFVGKNPQSNFFFDPVYGNEGCLCATVVLTITIILLLIKGRYFSENKKEVYL